MDVVSVSEETPKTKNKNNKITNNESIIKKLEEEMKKAADNLDFERAMELRDIIFEMKVNWQNIIYNVLLS